MITDIDKLAFIDNAVFAVTLIMVSHIVMHGLERCVNAWRRTEDA